ncbi:RHS repeat-associated core domain-containing protein [Streptomyces sp. NPDC008343]|uniref:RHS repeat-associated core domain-containing protein n=1 Tax=Streptomyces sp. NPDC008343 TaxID=3364828 RepID=UPI0036E160A7
MATATAKSLIAGLLSVVAFAPAAVALPGVEMPSVPGSRSGKAVQQPAESGMVKAPKVTWPKHGRGTIAVPAAGAKARAVAADGSNRAVVTVRAGKAPAKTGAKSSLLGSVPSHATVEVLDRKQIKPFGGIGLGVRVWRADGGELAGPVEATLDYSGFARAYGGAFASRLRLVKLPACAMTTPESPQCVRGQTVEGQRNDPGHGRLTAVLEAAPQPAAIPMVTQPAVYVLVSGSSSDKGDYRESPTNPSGTWDVSLGSGAFTYSVPIEVPKPPMGVAPELALTYNSQSVDGRTSASNNQASWVGMGWDLNVGAIERRYKNCTKDGHPTIGDMCWDSPNSETDENGAVYTITMDGVTSLLIQDNTGSGSSWRIKDDPGWRVQKLNGGFGSDDTREYWVVTKQDGTRYYFGWGRTERLNLDNERELTNSVLTVPVIGNNEGEPCKPSFPDPCQQAWRWSLDRVVTPNEVENSYFYNKETNHYRSVATAVDQPRKYDAGAYLSRIDYGWASQIPGAQLPAMIDFQHVNRCVERTREDDPLSNTPPNCPTFDASPSSYPDVPVDLICDGPNDGETCAGKTYYPTFFQRDVLWDINIHVRDTNTSGWDLVRQYQMKYEFMNPSGSVGEQLWLDYIQRRGYAGDDIDEPTINFNGQWQDNKVGEGELSFRRVNKIFTDTGATISATYGHATDAAGTIDRQCPTTGGTSQSDNHYECFWQKWTPEGAGERTGWFKKFVTKQVRVDPGKADDHAPPVITDYQYDGEPGWKFTSDPLTKDEDESWSDWRGYGKVVVTTGEAENRHSTYHWLYRGLDGDRTSKTDPTATRTVNVIDSDETLWRDHAWLAGMTLETSTRNHEGDSQKREWHEYWWQSTAQYENLPDARMVRETKLTTKEAVVNSADGTGWRTHVVQTEFDDTEKVSTVFGLPMRIDDHGEAAISDNQCTEFGRAYNTEDLADDSTGTKRWMVYEDDVRHYDVSCTQVAADEAAEEPFKNLDKRATTFYDGATSFTENNAKLVDGNPTEARAYTAETEYRTEKADFDAAGRPIKSWDGKGNLTTTAYNPATSWPINGTKVTTPDPDGSGPGAPLTTTTYHSRFWGHPWKTVDANGNVTQTVHDAVGRLTRVFKPTEAANYPDGTASMTFAYTTQVATSENGVPRVATGDPIRIKSQVLQTGTTYQDTYTYRDGLGREREVQVKAPSGTGRTASVTHYDASGNVAGTSGRFYNSQAPGSGMINPSIANLPSYHQAQADWAGRTIVAETQVNGTPQTAGRTTTQYQGADETTVFPAEGSPTKTITDVYGRTIKRVENLGAAQYTTTYEHTRTGELESLHDSHGNTSHYTYNWAGEELTSEDPDTGTSRTTYDNNGNIATTTDGEGRLLTHAYDALNRPTTIHQGTTLVTKKTYDTALGGKGSLTTAAAYAGGRAYTASIDQYDARGHVTAATTTVPDDGSGLNGSFTTKYSYDLADQLTKVEYPAIGKLPAETVTTTWNDGRISNVASGITTYMSAAGYDDIGRIRSRTLGTAGTDTSATRTFAYDDANGSGWLKNIITTTLTGGTSTKVQDDTYARNSAGSITALRENSANQQQCFAYDDLQRLTGAWTTAATSCAPAPASDFTGPDPYQTAWSYDRMGNIQSVVNKTSASTPAVTKDYKYPGYSADESTYTPDQPRPHAVSSVAKSSGSNDTYSYDAAGRMNGRNVAGVQSTIDWNAQDRIAKITQAKGAGTEATTYVYDADGNVLLRNAPSEKVLYLPGQELRTNGTAPAKATRYYTAGNASIAMRVADDSTNGTLTWLLSDAQASTHLAILAVGGAITRRRTNPFGEQRGTTGDLPAAMDRGFLGKPEDDSTGLSLLGARMYDPALGRFLSPDPVKTTDDPQNLSLYGYSRNNPINFSDPTGLVFDVDILKGDKPDKKKPKKRRQPYRTPNLAFCTHYSCYGEDGTVTGIIRDAGIGEVKNIRQSLATKEYNFARKYLGYTGTGALTEDEKRNWVHGADERLRDAILAYTGCVDTFKFAFCRKQVTDLDGYKKVWDDDYGPADLFGRWGGAATLTATVACSFAATPGGGFVCGAATGAAVGLIQHWASDEQHKDGTSYLRAMTEGAVQGSTGGYLGPALKAWKASVELRAQRASAP